MSNVIDLASRQRDRSTKVRYAVIDCALAIGQSIVVGTSDIEQTFNKLKLLFPNAIIERLDGGIKVSPCKK